MFFVLAKVLWFLLQPSTLILGALVIGAILLFTAWQRLARGVLWVR